MIDYSNIHINKIIKNCEDIIIIIKCFNGKMIEKINFGDIILPLNTKKIIIYVDENFVSASSIINKDIIN